jgi:hypothetical protein
MLGPQLWTKLICVLVGWYERWLAAYKGICHTKIILFFYGSDHSCSTGGCWQCMEILTICEQVLQHVVVMLIGRTGQVKKNFKL